MKNRKKAISLAEIIIVVVIVAIVALIFITMPKKNVGKMDKAKYYVAYDLLKQLQNEQLANDENNDKKVSLTDFGNQAKKWLNIISSDTNKVTISNGMIIEWENTPSSCEVLLGHGCLRVTIDIDGENSGTDTENEDKHSFYLTENGQVIPHQNSNNADGSVNDWITFKVYEFNDDDGSQNFLMTNVSYITAYNCVEKNIGEGCNNCNDYNGNYYCFMEAVPPLR